MPVTYATSAEDRVYATRRVPLKSNALPALAVYTADEDVDRGSQESAPLLELRTVQLVIEGMVRLTSAVDDALDSLALEVEQALDLTDTLDNTVSRLRLNSTECHVFPEGDQPIGLCRLVYDAEYVVEHPIAALTTHPRKAIRDAAAARLVSSSGDAVDSLHEIDTAVDLNSHTEVADQMTDTLTLEGA